MRTAVALLATCAVLTTACPQRPTPRAPDRTELAENELFSDAGGPGESFEACLDRVLEEAGLNRYGDERGRMYTGGTPLFDETTGATRSRRAYVEARRPDLVARCVER